MYSPIKCLDKQVDFKFPFTPYTIQQQLMEELYMILEQKKIGIFESPTGTGKSLTLTCAALKWLEDHEQRVQQELTERLEYIGKQINKLEKENATASDWIAGHAQIAKQREEYQNLKELQKLLYDYEQKLKDIESNHKYKIKQRRQDQPAKPAYSSNSFESLVDEVDLDVLKEESREDNEDEDLGDDGESNLYKDVKIYYCSRTHSQLSQVVKEIRRTAYGKKVRCVSLASRQQLCINPQIRRLNSAELINERCLDINRNSKSSSKVTSTDCSDCVQKKRKLADQQQTTGASAHTKCAYKVVDFIQELSEAALMNIMDVEDLLKEGGKQQGCPYYAVRNAIQMAQIIMLPYQMLLHRKTRIQSGIDLKGAILIIDEAHNLLDSISQIYSCAINLQQLRLAQQQILAYKNAYSVKFNSNNLLSINQMLFVIKRLIKLLEADKTVINGESTRVLTTYQLMSEGEFFNIDLYQLLTFCEKSRFVQKIQGLYKKMNSAAGIANTNSEYKEVKCDDATVKILKRLEKNYKENRIKPQRERKNIQKLEQLTLNGEAEIEVKGTNESSLSCISSLWPLLKFLEALTEKAGDGRIIIHSTKAKSEEQAIQSGYKYILLNPGNHFQEIIKDARAIIVAGGTMQPTLELTQQLFKSCPERVQQHFYDHVVDDDAVSPFVITKGPSGRNLCFNFQHRSTKEMLCDLSAILENLSNVVPAGLICFLPSYDYLNGLYNHLQETGVLQRISRKKRIFKEPHQTSGGKHQESIEQLLADYSRSIRLHQGGALLLSVVGAKLSEGLNFSDNLGRGIIVVGLPYPNRNAPELQERINYLDMAFGKGAGNEYYENLCIKAVNQCIGRAIRHIRDYACVYLLDERYAKEGIYKKLPKWISRRLNFTTNYGQVQMKTVKFFKQKHNINSNISQ